MAVMSRQRFVEEVNRVNKKTSLKAGGHRGP
jgi:hypothetical protein